MTGLRPAPTRVAQLVTTYVWRQHNDVAQYENRQHLDDSAVYSLHELTRHAYGEGWEDGVRYQNEAGRNVDSARRLDAVSALHQRMEDPDGPPRCVTCTQDPWPCDTRKALDS